MKSFLRSLAPYLAIGVAVGLLLYFFTVWQACVLILLTVTAFFVFRILDMLSVLAKGLESSRSLSRQLSNLYVFIAWNGVPSDTLETCNTVIAGSTKLLSAWERLNKIRFLGNGMTPDEAESAASDESQKQRRWIAELTPERIANGCNKQGSFSDPVPGQGPPNKTLCPKCAIAYTEAKQKWAEILASEKMGKSLPLHQYLIPVPPCSLPKTGCEKDTDGWYVTCECGFEKRCLGLDDALSEKEEHYLTHDPVPSSRS